MLPMGCKKLLTHPKGLFFFLISLFVLVFPSEVTFLFLTLLSSCASSAAASASLCFLRRSSIALFLSSLIRRRAIFSRSETTTPMLLTVFPNLLNASVCVLACSDCRRSSLLLLQDLQICMLYFGHVVLVAPSFYVLPLLGMPPAYSHRFPFPMASDYRYVRYSIYDDASVKSYLHSKNGDSGEEGHAKKLARPSSLISFSFPVLGLVTFKV